MLCPSLETYIGIRGCDPETPESGLYMEDLTGISMLLASNVAGAKDGSGENLLERVRKLAVMALTDEIISGLSAKGLILREQRNVLGADSLPLDISPMPAGETFSATIYGADSYHKTILDRINVRIVADGTVSWVISVPGQDDMSGSEAVTAGAEKTINIREEWVGDAEIQVSADQDLYYYGKSECACLSGISRGPARFWLHSLFDFCALLYEYRRIILPALRDALAITFMREARSSERINHAARASEALYRETMVHLTGGIDPETGFVHKGSYAKNINMVVEALEGEICDRKIQAFDSRQTAIIWNKM